MCKMKSIVRLLVCDMEHSNSLGRESAWCLVFLRIVCESLYEFSCLCISVNQQDGLSFKLWQPFSIHGRTLLHPSSGLVEAWLKYAFSLVGWVIFKTRPACVHLTSVYSMEKMDF